MSENDQKRERNVDSNSLITLENITAGYGDDMQVLSDISMNGGEKEVITLAGPNGAGKSTLLKTIAGLVMPTSGSVLYRDDDITTIPTDERLKRGISFIPQGRSVFANMSIKENLLMGGYSFDDEVTTERVNEIFELFPELERRSSDLATSLSGGQQQMLELGRGLVSEPEIILIDEPSLGIAPKILANIFQIIRELADEGRCVIMVEQNVYQALEVSDRAYILADGQIRFEGQAHEVRDDKRMGELYLGG